VKIPVDSNAREEHILEERRNARARLKNSSLARVRARARQMKRDPRYVAAAQMKLGPERTREFRKLLAEYKLRPFDVNNAVQEIWRESLWMPLVLHSNVGDAIAQEVHGEVSRWLVRLTGEPYPKPRSELGTIWGRAGESGIQWSEKKGKLMYPQPGKNAPVATKKAYPEFRPGRKDLALGFAKRHGPGSSFWEKYVGDRRIVRAGLTRERRRGGWMWFALLTVEGAPYRNPERSRLIEAKRGRHVGVDVNVSNVAAVGESEALLIPLISREHVKRQQQDAKRMRRRQRALERSLRATNPNAYDSRGRKRRGKRLRNRSGRATRLQDALAVDARHLTLNRKREQARVAATVLMRLGTELAMEKVSVKAWQKHWGRRIALTAPAATMNVLAAEALRHGGSVMELPPRLALSQTCLCGSKVRKDLSTRAHACENCGLGIEDPVDRDIFSGLMARLVSQLGIDDFCAAVREGTLADEYGRLGGASELSVRELLAHRTLRVPSPSPRLTAGKRKTVSRSRRGASSPDGVRALDGLPSGKVAHSGSKVSAQTDGTTPRAPLAAPAGSLGRRATGVPTGSKSQPAFGLGGRPDLDVRELEPQSLIWSIEGPK
jgi:putative transposase